MASNEVVPAQLSDGDLLAEVARLATCERQATAALVALLAEVDVRRLHLVAGCSSLFTYCTERLHLSEHAAYHRIEAARAVRAFPVILEHLRAGSLTLTAVTLLRPHLTAENHERLLAAACGRSKREVEVLVRSVAPLPDARASVRRLPAASSAAVAICETASPAAWDARDDARAVVSPPATPMVPASKGGPPTRDVSLTITASNRSAEGMAPSALHAQPRPAAIRVLAPERYSLRVTLSAEGHARLRRAQDLLRHTVPDGDPAVIVDRALALLVEQLERTKFAARRTRTAESDRRDAEMAAHGTPREAAEDAGPDIDRARRAPPAPTLAPSASRTTKRSLRTIPAEVRRAVWARDEGRCTFRGEGGRCRETGRLEFHHRIPVADGGAASVENLELLCAAHHAYESARWFGGDVWNEPAGHEPAVASDV